MLREGGWAEIIDSGARQVVARGHLHVDDLDAATGNWHGRLDTVHPSPGAPALESGGYLLSLERHAEQIMVRVELADGAVRVYGDDDILPSTLVQRTTGI